MTLPSAHRSAQSLQLEALEAREVPAAPFEQLPVLPDWDPEVIANARRIAERGAALGRNPQAFIKFGDSNTRDPGYLTQLGDPGYNPVVTGLATQHPELVDVWLKYRAPLAVGGNSYTQDSAASIYGGNLAQVLPRLPLEIALRNPSVALVMIGSNDQVIYSPETYRSLLETTLDQMAAAGVVPVLSTIPDIPAYMGRGPQIRAYNQVIAEVAEEKDVLLVNYFWVQAGLPFLALNYSEPFPVHLTTSPRGGGWFHPFDLVFGQNSRNLVTLQALDWLEEKVFSAPAAPALPDSPA